MKKHNNSGISMVYVMIALIIIGFTATALIKLSHKNALTQIGYSNSESARLAVHSGFEKALSFFESDKKDSILAILNKWNDTNDPSTISNNYRWIVGDPSKFDSIYSDCKFKVQILGFDASNYSISLHSEGLTSTGNKASAVGTYYLDGLGYDKITSTGKAPVNALQMDNGNFEFNCKLTIEGNTSVFDKMKMNIGPAIFDGGIRIDKHRTSGAIGKTTFDVNTKIIGNGYFEGPIVSNKKLEVFGNAGFDDTLAFGQYDFYMPDTSVLPVDTHHLYLNNGTRVDGSWQADLVDAVVHAYNGSGAIFHFDSDKSKGVKDCYAADDYDTVTTKISDLPGKLSLGDVPPKVHFNYKIPLEHPNKKTLASGKSLSADTLNAWYNTQKTNGQLWDNKFLVVHVPSSYATSSGKLIASSSTAFSGKAIIIVESTNWQTILGFKTTSTANCAIYISDFNKYTNAFSGLTEFRGFIYINKATNYVVFHTAPSSFCHYKGAIYAGENGSTKFDGGIGKHHMVTFDQGVINDLDSLGIFTDPDSVVTEDESKLVFTKSKLESELLSRSF